jgi:succinyl-CoA synthetase alpha subunit
LSSPAKPHVAEMHRLSKKHRIRVTAPPGKRMGHAGALISGGADTADAKLAVMEECGFTITRNPSEMAKLLKALL